MRIIYIPLETYDRRYTRDWVEQFENEFLKNKIDYITMQGQPLVKKLGSASDVLDSCGTNYFKATQLANIMKRINDGTIGIDGDVFLFADLWFPGIESLFYVRNNLKLNFKITGVLHAGSWDKFDFTYRNGMRPWAEHIERGWLKDFDMVFVATSFHRELIFQNLIKGKFENEFEIISKIKVTGIPFYAGPLRYKHLISYDLKENIVVFPHRLAPEKNPEVFDMLAEMLPEYKFVKTVEATKNSVEYFDLLARSKVMLSFADQETFGYSTVEAMALDNYVMVPDALSYKETVPRECRYEPFNFKMPTTPTLERLAMSIRGYMSTKIAPSYPELKTWEKSIVRMLNHIKELTVVEV